MFEANTQSGLIKMYGVIGDDITAADFTEARSIQWMART